MTPAGSGGVAVVDASLVTMWVLPERYTPLALALAADWARAGVRALAPCFMLAEVTNALYKRVVRGELPVGEMQQALEVVLGFGIHLEERPDLHREALAMAQRLSRPSTYDAHYLALANLRGCELWTGDERLFNAVRQQAPWLRWIGAYVPSADPP